MRYRAYKLQCDGQRFIFIPDIKKIFTLGISAFNKLPLAFDIEDETASVSSFPNTISTTPSTVLIITERCNLNCIYCYEGGVRKKANKPMMSEIALSAIDHSLTVAVNTKAQGTRLIFFGGEPTLEFKSMQGVYDYYVNKSQTMNLTYRTGIATNGAFSSTQRQWLAQNIDFISFSLDGPPSVQDIHRSKSSKCVIDNAIGLHNSVATKLNFRSTVSNISVEKLPEITQWFATTFPACRLHFEPLSPHTDNCSHLVPEPTMFFNKFLESLDVAEREHIKIKTSVSELKANSQAFCGAAGSNFVVSPNGEVVSCHRYALSPIIKKTVFWFGSYSTQKRRFMINKKRRRALTSMKFNSIQYCQDCFAASFCRGDCPAAKYATTPHDFSFKPSFRCQEIKEFIAKILARECKKIDN